MDSTTPLKDQTISEHIYTRWATRADFSAIARIFHSFLLDFELHDHAAPRRKEKPEEFYLFCLLRIRTLFFKPGVRFQVAERIALTITGEEREILGFSAWHAQGERNAVQEEWVRQDESMSRAFERQLVYLENLHHQYAVNMVFDYSAFGKMFAIFDAAYAQDESLKNNMHLQLLAVAPKWRKGHGVGRRLIQWGIDVANKTGLPITFESSLGGFPFYLRMGCELLTKVRIDLDPKLAYDMPVMVYRPGDSTA